MEDVFQHLQEMPETVYITRFSSYTPCIVATNVDLSFHVLCPGASFVLLLLYFGAIIT
jgi:hypothetical protein